MSERAPRDWLVEREAWTMTTGGGGGLDAGPYRTPVRREAETRRWQMDFVVMWVSSCVTIVAVVAIIAFSVSSYDTPIRECSEMCGRSGSGSGSASAYVEGSCVCR